MIDPNDPHVKDTRSPLAKALGDRGIAVHILDLYDGTGHDLDGIPMALRTVSNAIRVKATADALHPDGRMPGRRIALRVYGTSGWDRDAFLMLRRDLAATMDEEEYRALRAGRG